MRALSIGHLREQAPYAISRRSTKELDEVGDPGCLATLAHINTQY